MAGGQRQTGQHALENLPLKEGGLFGAGAYVAGFILTFVLVQIDGDIEDEIMVARFDEFGIDSVEVASWVYSSAHLIVDLKSELSGGSESETETVSLFSEVSTSLPEPVYYAVPVLVLVGAGYLLVQQTSIHSSTEAMKAGATLSLGYLPLAVVSALLFRVSESQSAFGQTVELTVGPDIVMVGVAAVLFPAVLGTSGGYLAFSREGSDQQGGYQQQPPANPRRNHQGGQQRQQGRQPRQGGQRQQGGQQRQQGGQQRQQGGQQRQQGGQQRRDTRQR